MNKQSVVQTFTYRDGFRNLSKTIIREVEDYKRYMQEEVEILLRAFANSQSQHKETIDLVCNDLSYLFSFGGEIEGDVVKVSFTQIGPSLVISVTLDETFRTSEMTLVHGKPQQTTANRCEPWQTSVSPGSLVNLK